MEELLRLAECSGALDAMAVCIRRLLDHGQKHGYEFDLEEVKSLAVSCGKLSDKLREIAGEAF